MGFERASDSEAAVAPQEGEEDPVEKEGKRRAFAARGDMQVDTSAQGWMGGGAHNQKSNRSEIG